MGKSNKLKICKIIVCTKTFDMNMSAMLCKYILISSIEHDEKKNLCNNNSMIEAEKKITSASIMT